MFDVEESLRELVRREGSDLHLKVGSAPLYRVHGHLAAEPGVDALSAEDTEHTLHELLHDEVKLHEFAEEHEVDFSFEIEGVARYRINEIGRAACRARGPVP